MTSNLLYICEIANNHRGSVERAKAIIDAHSTVCVKHGVKVAFKLQFRQLDSLIHPDFRGTDTKHIKRFEETAMTKEQFTKVVSHIRKKGHLVAATPFDEGSLEWIEEFDVDILKVASCSIDDWPLIERVRHVNRLIVASTAGASRETLQRFVSMMRSEGRDFALMHCVGEYPTLPEHANLSRIDELRTLLGPDRLRVGISTHESPSSPSVVPSAVVKGCTIIEKHVDIDSDGMRPNAYSCLPSDIDALMGQVETAQSMLVGKSPTEHDQLRELKRGVYSTCALAPGDIVSRSMLYLAMPCHRGQLDASGLETVIGVRLEVPVSADGPIPLTVAETVRDRKLTDEFVSRAAKMLDRAGLAYSTDDDVELSTHYGLSEFERFGALIIDKVNREYCKKLIVMLPNQHHPAHHHVKKEEVFELLNGDCTLSIDGMSQPLQRGKPILIPRGSVHSFSSEDGCVVEEVSTTHHQGDSIYEDPRIFKLELSERKIRARFTRSSR